MIRHSPALVSPPATWDKATTAHRSPVLHAPVSGQAAGLPGHQEGAAGAGVRETAAPDPDRGRNDGPAHQDLEGSPDPRRDEKLARIEWALDHARVRTRSSAPFGSPLTQSRLTGGRPPGSADARPDASPPPVSHTRARVAGEQSAIAQPRLKRGNRCGQGTSGVAADDPGDIPSGPALPGGLCTTALLSSGVAAV